MMMRQTNKQIKCVIVLAVDSTNKRFYQSNSIDQIYLQQFGSMLTTHTMHNILIQISRLISDPIWSVLCGLLKKMPISGYILFLVFLSFFSLTHSFHNDQIFFFWLLSWLFYYYHFFLFPHFFMDVMGFSPCLLKQYMCERENWKKLPNKHRQYSFIDDKMFVFLCFVLFFSGKLIILTKEKH